MNIRSVASLPNVLTGSENFVPNPVLLFQGYPHTNGDVAEPTTIDAPSGLNATLIPLNTVVAGSVYLVPKPDDDHAYADTYEPPVCAIAITVPSGLNSTSFVLPGGKVVGLLYLVPKPEPDQGYACMYGVAEVATAIAVPSGLNATEFPVVPGRVDGLVYLVPKPVDDDQG